MLMCLLNYYLPLTYKYDTLHTSPLIIIAPRQIALVVLMLQGNPASISHCCVDIDKKFTEINCNMSHNIWAKFLYFALLWS